MNPRTGQTNRIIQQGKTCSKYNGAIVGLVANESREAGPDVGGCGSVVVVCGGCWRLLVVVVSFTLWHIRTQNATKTLSM